MQGLRSRLAYLVWDVQPRVSAVIVTPAWSCPLEGGLSCKLRIWVFLFFPLAACGLRRVVRAKISKARSRMRSLTGFGLSCWHCSEALAMKLQCWMVPDSEASETLAWEGALQTSPFPGGAATRLPTEGAMVTERCTMSTQQSEHQGFSKPLSLFRRFGGSW